MQQRPDVRERASARSRRASTVNGSAVRAEPGPPTSELDFDDGTYRRFRVSTEDCRGCCGTVRLPLGSSHGKHEGQDGRSWRGGALGRRSMADATQAEAA